MIDGIIKIHVKSDQHARAVKNRIEMFVPDQFSAQELTEFICMGFYKLEWRQYQVVAVNFALQTKEQGEDQVNWKAIVPSHCSINTITCLIQLPSPINLNLDYPKILLNVLIEKKQDKISQVFKGLPELSHCSRRQKIRSLYQTLMEYQYVLVTAPPQSDKTSTALLLNELATQTNPMLPSIYISFAGLQSSNNASRFFKIHTGRDYEEFIASENDVILVVDEAQLLYDQDWFWQGFKSRGKRTIYVLAFAIYGSNSRCIAGSPILFKKKLSYADIS